MPHVLKIDEDIYTALVESFGEETLKERIDDIFLSALESKLELYSREILKFEEKYGMSFKEFSDKWDKGEIKDKYSYEVESDFIDWEMLEMEKRDLILAISKLRSIRKK